jgi:hypothetical protein
MVQAVLSAFPDGAFVEKKVKPYPNHVLLTAVNPATHQREPRYYRVESAEHEAKLRLHVKKQVEQLEFLRAVALNAQRQQLIEYKRKETNAKA